MIDFFVMIARFFVALWQSLKKEPQARAVFIFLVIMLLSGTIFFVEIEHWHWVDALYYCVLTLATVGTGDFVPQTQIGRIFTIIYLFMGLGVFVAAANIIAKHAFAQEHESPFEKIRKTFAKKKDNKEA